MLDQVRETVTAVLCHLEVQFETPEEAAIVPRRRPAVMRETRQDPALVGANGDGGPPPPPMTVRHARADVIDPDDPSTWGKIGRNTPCPCDSGRKYKHCHGRLA